MHFDSRNWFWIVGDDEARAWSSAASAYVNAWPVESVTRIPNETELTDVLRGYGLPGPAPTQQDYSDAIQAHIDTLAQSRSYRHGDALASYAGSSVPTWAAEAAAFVAWRDAVWLYAHAQLAAVQAQEREQPTVEGLIAELPPMVWPD